MCLGKSHESPHIRDQIPLVIAEMKNINNYLSTIKLILGFGEGSNFNYNWTLKEIVRKEKKNCTLLSVTKTVKLFAGTSLFPVCSRRVQ